jgi:hypothetical protein
MHGNIRGLDRRFRVRRPEFGVTRLDEIKANSPIAGRRYPACRLALSSNAAVELINRMQQIATLLTLASPIKPGDGPARRSV